MSGDTDMQLFERIIRRSQGDVLREIQHVFSRLENRMSQLDDAIAAAQAQITGLQTEVANANAKTDAALAALAASVASQTPVTQAQLDAITALGTSAAADTASLQAEEAKVDAALNPAGGTPSGSASASGAST